MSTSPARPEKLCLTPLLDVCLFVVLTASYAYFWHNRDWNVSARLMLTYAMVDRGTVVLNGLDDHSRDLAMVDGRYYSDKTPGYSLLAAVPYALSRLMGFPPHPLDRPGPSMPYWPADYCATLGASALPTAIAAVLLARISRELGCGPRRSAILALGYGLGSNAWVYATLAYGHQPAACALLSSFSILWFTRNNRGAKLPIVFAGALAAFASVIELQAGPLSALLGIYLLVQVVVGKRGAMAIVFFAAGAFPPTAVLLGYDYLAFGNIFDQGYFHLHTPRFAKVHSLSNPLGLTAPSRAPWRLSFGAGRGAFCSSPP